jgi:hypothetical protein
MMETAPWGQWSILSPAPTEARLAGSLEQRIGEAIEGASKEDAGPNPRCCPCEKIIIDHVMRSLIGCER